MAMADWARKGWGLADEALRQMFREMTERGETSATLNYYMMEVSRGQIRHGPGPRVESQYFRDVVVAMIVGQIVDKFALNPFRNTTTRRKPSACSIVAEAVGGMMTEDVVGAIWKRMKKYF
jgi:hypothetical protein